jgi:hypothetical protein
LPRLDSRDARSQFIGWLQSRRSWNTYLVVGIAAAAAVIRFWNFGSLGYSHWDEYFFVSDSIAVSHRWPHGLETISWNFPPLVAYTSGTLFHLFGINQWVR